MFLDSFTDDNISPRPRGNKDEGAPEADEMNLVVDVDVIKMEKVTMNATTNPIPKGGRGRFRRVVGIVVR